MANKQLDLTFRRFGHLIAVRMHSLDENGRWHWLMRCNCGNLVIRSGSQLKASEKVGKVASCGCIHHLKTHGLTKTHRNLQWVWSAMKSRCYSSTCKDYQSYGGRGIAVCDAWMAFANFAAWALETGYERGLTIERVDVDGSYQPSNCTWVDNRLQARNRTNTHLYTIGDETLDIRAWSERSGIPYYALRSRLINYKWPIERAITEPVRVYA